MNKAAPKICSLSHAGFRMLGEPVFRLSEGTRIPSMVVQLEGQEAVLPLHSIAREFRVEPTSADGQMLLLIEQALDFVVALKLGDKLPSELNGGTASWEPDKQDRRLAASRVRHNLVRCVFARLGKTVTVSGGGASGWEDEPRNQALLQQAITGAVAHLEGMDGAGVSSGVESISEEMAYIEAMRRTLARGISGIREKLLQLQLGEVPMSHQETVKQVQGLARLGIKEITGRFDDVDARLDDILAMLRDLQTVIAGLRRQRDWLFRTNRAWATVFTEWAAAPKHFDDFLLKVVEKSYLFLAPRFMSFQEWTSAEARMKNKQVKVTVW